MNFKLVKKDAFRVVGVAENIHQDMEKNFGIIPAMWDKAQHDGTLDTLCTLIGNEPKAILGMVLCDDPKQWRYAIVVASDEKVESPLTQFVIPEATWAVFYGEGTNKSIQDLIIRAHTEWLPSSGFEFGNAPEIEVYYTADPDNATYEVWLPVISKG